MVAPFKVSIKIFDPSNEVFICILTFTFMVYHIYLDFQHLMFLFIIFHTIKSAVGNFIPEQVSIISDKSAEAVKETNEHEILQIKKQELLEIEKRIEGKNTELEEIETELFCFGIHVDSEELEKESFYEKTLQYFCDYRDGNKLDFEKEIEGKHMSAKDLYFFYEDKLSGYRKVVEDLKKEKKLIEKEIKKIERAMKNKNS